MALDRQRVDARSDRDAHAVWPGDSPHPEACGTPDSFPRGAHLSIVLDGEFAGSGSTSFHPSWAGRVHTLAVSFYPVGNALLAPGADLTRVVTARVADSCAGAGQDYTFESLKIDVVAAR